MDTRGFKPRATYSPALRRPSTDDGRKSRKRKGKDKKEEILAPPSTVTSPELMPEPSPNPLVPRRRRRMVDSEIDHLTSVISEMTLQDERSGQLIAQLQHLRGVFDEVTQGWVSKQNPNGPGWKERWLVCWRQAAFYFTEPVDARQWTLAVLGERGRKRALHSGTDAPAAKGGLSLLRYWAVEVDRSNPNHFHVRGPGRTFAFRALPEKGVSRDEWCRAFARQMQINAKLEELASEIAELRIDAALWEFPPPATRVFEIPENELHQGAISQDALVPRA